MCFSIKLYLSFKGKLLISANIFGFPSAPRPIITASTPVWSILLYELISTTSPLPITGIFTLALTFAIVSKSTAPEYICSLVLPCIVIALAPASSQILATCTAMFSFSANPFLNLQVIGLALFFTQLFTICSSNGKFFKSADPSPFLTILGAGQPKFMSIKSNLFKISNEQTFAISSALWPKIWTAFGVSNLLVINNSFVFSLLCKSAVAFTISV